MQLTMKKFILFVAAAIVSVVPLQAQEVAVKSEPSVNAIAAESKVENKRFLPMRQRIDRNIDKNKFVYKGDPIIIPNDPANNMDLTQEYFVAEEWGAAIAMAGNSGIGRYEFS